MRIEDTLGEAILEILKEKPYTKIRHHTKSLDGTIKETTKEEYIANIDTLIEEHRNMQYFINSLPYATDFNKDYDNYFIQTNSRLASSLQEWITLKKYRKYTTVKCFICNGTGARMVAGSGYAPCNCSNGQTSEEIY